MTKKKTKYPITTIVLIVLIIIAVGGFVMYNMNKTPEEPGESKPVKQVSDSVMDVFVMSQCPYGVQVEDELAKVKTRLGEKFTLNIEFIGGEENGEFTSLHGEPEVKGDMIQACVKELYPGEVIHFIECQNEDVSDLVGSIGKCAEKLSMDAEKINECFKGDQGKELLSASFKRSEEAGATGSPTIILQGKKYEGARDELSLTRAVCNALDDKPEACDGIPACASHKDCTAEEGKEGFCENAGEESAECVYKEPEQFDLVVINDKECKSCDASQIIAGLKKIFLGAQVKEIDVSEAQDLIDANGIVKVPAVLVEGKIKESAAWETVPNIGDAFEEVEYGLKLLDEVTRATHFVSDDAEKAHLDKLGVKLNDNKPQIDFFVMSYCPYGNIAEEAIAPAYEKLGDAAEFNPRYVIYSNYRGGGPDYCFDEEDQYCSMHGIVELNQNLRELCVAELSGTGAYFEFVTEMNKKCDAKNADTCWTGVAEGLGYDTEAVQTCFDENALSYLEADKELNTLYGVSGSPAVFIDGQAYTGARSPKGYMAALCDAFDEPPAACDDVDSMEGASAASTPTGGCG